MKILIAYATTDGQSRKIARFAADRLADSGHAVELLCVDDAKGLDLTRFHGVIVGGSGHMGGYQKALTRFVTEAQTALGGRRRLAADGAWWQTALGGKPSLMLSVSLSAAGTDAEDWAGIHKCVAQFEADTGWIPGRVEPVAGAFRFSEYDFFRAWAMRRIADQKGETIEAGKDKEYTDWDKLGAVLDDWAAGIAA